jgi:hypothetical protein
MATITINGVSLDPLAQAPALAAQGLVADDASKSDYILIQTKQPLDAAQKAQLDGLGAKVLEYVPQSTYVAYYKPSDLSAIRALPFVAWANVYMQGFKVAPSLRPAPVPAGANLLALAATPAHSIAQNPRTVDVVLHDNVAPDSVRDQIARAAHLDPKDLTMSRHKARVVVQPRFLPALAAIDGVRHIEEVQPKKLMNDVARGILRADPSPNGAPLQGEGQIVAVADTGFDKGSTANVHPAFQGRVVKLYPLGRTRANDPNGHGTHVAGSVLGDGNSPALGGPVQGTAPRARLIVQSLLDPRGDLGGIPDDLHDLFLPPYQNDGARVHTNSWGDRNGDGSYSSQSGELDDFVWNNRDCVVCFAAGNDGADRQGTGRVAARSVGAPATAKNCITVGASENNRPAFALRYGQGWPTDFPAEPIRSDRVADNPDGMAAFSGRGSTTDGRIKPDVVAPGTAILSTLSRDVASPSTDWGVSADPLYFFDGGTSMATPLVAGCVAVVREHLAKNHNLANPSAALVKALLINGAFPIPGQYTPSETGPAPNNADGFGRVDLRATVGPYQANESVTFKDEATALDTGQEERLTVTVAPPVASLKVTLVWTDPAGEALQNDLDLIVRAGGLERHGNVDPSSQAFDRINNVEQVVWDGVPPGPAEIVVRAFRVTRFPQPYALVLRLAPLATGAGRGP